jgi:hypothetical protein
MASMVAVSTKLANQGLRFGIGRQSDGEISISRKPWLGADRNCQAANQGEEDVDSREVGVDLA